MRSRPFRALMAASVAAVLTAALATSQGAAAGVPQAHDPSNHPTPMTKLGTNTNTLYSLRWDEIGPDKRSYRQLITQLRGALALPKSYRYTNISQLLGQPGHTALSGPVGCPDAKRSYGALGGPYPVRSDYWICLNTVDSTTKRWYPQGVSGTWDATASGVVDGEQAFAFGWYRRASTTNRTPIASRVTFLDEQAPMGSFAHRYQHVLLALPRYGKNGVTFDSVPTHAGGLVWYHQYLLVADDGPRHEFNGILVFDLHNLIDLALSPRADLTSPQAATRPYGLYKGRFYSKGYRFILPLRGIWRPSVGPLTTPQKCRAGDLHYPPCYTYAGLDRSTSPPSFLTGEWCTSSACGKGRVARFPLMPDNIPCTRGCLRTSGGRARPTEVFSQPVRYAQGGVSWKGTYQFTTSHGGAAGRFVTRPGTTVARHYAGTGVQDLYWNRATSTPMLWSVTEFPGTAAHPLGRRLLYGVRP
ncbi:hypothetical protein SAMN05421833_12087 [Microbispora rosea]|uniref:Secreted protein n=1 Tax=Microbispora rosea TaxID=58117 RepID=A0A1N7F2M2_9ACTN|nr:hypothetical protein [Microbispora rosea]GIH48653.1 hypothetical protein Mro03_38320 [Microbispora rosea subsp. rosea]SIR94587.1 hypothetical protein SAMN05421833_12087 [Microbispora rosea]